MDEIWKREEIESPCVKTCLIDPNSKYCIGCGRTGIEIASWSQISSNERSRIMATLPERLQKMQPRRKGGRKRNR